MFLVALRLRIFILRIKILLLYVLKSPSVGLSFSVFIAACNFASSYAGYYYDTKVPQFFHIGMIGVPLSFAPGYTESLCATMVLFWASSDTCKFSFTFVFSEFVDTSATLRHFPGKVQPDLCCVPSTWFHARVQRDFILQGTDYAGFMSFLSCGDSKLVAASL